MFSSIIIIIIAIQPVVVFSVVDYACLNIIEFFSPLSIALFGLIYSSGHRDVNIFISY